MSATSIDIMYSAQAGRLIFRAASRNFPSSAAKFTTSLLNYIEEGITGQHNVREEHVCNSRVLNYMNWDMFMPILFDAQL